MPMRVRRPTHVGVGDEEDRRERLHERQVSHANLADGR